ncbi:nickel pincer cofactor biosynthesis protein LarC [Anaerocolumna jejuensis]|uniref:nickel pincer cofactor biosynthesis protein LarC n=1 Tax=Anaerocolumna jejuensis TaxID=259063 RepID=UPI003F7C59D4
MKKHSLYLECYSGISGDMMVAALLDLGADREVLLNGLKSLKVDGYRIEITRKAKNSIDACDFNVILAEDNHDHDMDYLFGHEKPVKESGKSTAGSVLPLSQGTPSLRLSTSYKLKRLHGSRSQEAEHSHGHAHEDLHSHNHADVHNHSHNDLHSYSHEGLHSHSHDDLHSHSHDDLHSHSHGSSGSLHFGHHEHRNLQDIYTIIDGAAITENAKSIAKRIFFIIAEAESKAHGKPVEEVHFHEVGATDSIVDITAAAICLDNLDIKEVYVSELYEGRGQITCQHGVLPIPVPAVVNISAKYGLKLHLTQVKGELVTPTGAAIVAAIKTKEQLPADFTIRGIGLGTGKREYEQTSFLRAMLIEEALPALPDTIPDTVWVLEANVDDCSGEALSAAMDILLKKGARDVYYTPIFMKKNRPAYLLGVICSEKDISAMEELIFTHTTTIGIRKQEMKRTTLKRSFKTLMTPYGEATVKVCSFQDKTFYYPESDSIRSLADKSGLDYTTLYSLVQTLAGEASAV